MNWTYTDCNSSRENPRYICIFFVCFLFVVLVKLEIFFLSFLFSIFSLLCSFKLPHYSPITPQLSFSYIFIIFFQLGKKNLFFFYLFFFCFVLFCFSVLFLFSFFLVFFFFSLFSFACFSLLFPFKVL